MNWHCSRATVARRGGRGRGARVLRDYAYFIENRLRERYRLEGVPAIIDFVEREERVRHGRTRRA